MDLQGLMELCMRPAPLGDEGAVREWICGRVGPGLEIRTDPAGSLLIRKPGRKPGLALMAGLSQPTVLVTGRTSEGAWRLQPLGIGDPLEKLENWTVCDRQGASGTLCVREGRVHLEKMRNIRLGTRLTRMPDWSIQEKEIRCCNLADRVGCWILMEILQALPDTEAEISCIFLAQEAYATKAAELAANALAPAVVIRFGAAPAEDEANTGAPLRAGGGPALELRERYASTDGRLMDLLRGTCEKECIPYQYELLGRTVTGLFCAQYGRCGVVVGGVDVPEKEGRMLLSDVEGARALALALVRDAQAVLARLDSLPAVRHMPQKEIKGGEL